MERGPIQMSWDLDEEGKEGLRPKLSPMSWIDEHQSDLFNKSTNLVRMDCKIHVLHPPIRVCHISILQIITHEWISNVTHNHNSPKPKSSHFLSNRSAISSTSRQILSSSMEMAPKLSNGSAIIHLSLDSAGSRWWVIFSFSYWYKDF